MTKTGGYFSLFLISAVKTLQHYPVAARTICVSDSVTPIAFHIHADIIAVAVQCASTGPRFVASLAISLMYTHTRFVVHIVFLVAFFSSVCHDRVSVNTDVRKIVWLDLLWKYCSVV